MTPDREQTRRDAPLIRRSLAVLDGSDFDANDFPGMEIAQAAGHELDALLAELEQAEARIAAVDALLINPRFASRQLTRKEIGLTLRGEA